MISNPAFLFGFYSRRVITGRKSYKRLPGNDGKDVTFYIKTTLIPPQTSKIPFLPDPSHRCHQPPCPLGVWGPPHTQGGSNPPVPQARGEGAVGGRSWQPQPLSPGATEAGQGRAGGQPREDGGREGGSSEAGAGAGLLLVQSNAAPWCADLLREIPGFRHVNSPRVTL